MGYIFNLVILIGFFYACWKVGTYLESRRWEEEQEMVLPTGQKIRYIIGSYVNYEGLEFHGIWLLMPKAMPHIYIDNHGDGRIVGPDRYIKSKERISLEGDFDKYFQVFAPRPFHTFALRVLTPDVMNVLVENLHSCDVEISGASLRIMRAKRFKKDSEEARKLVDLAKVLAAELTKQTKVWSTEEQARALGLKLAKRSGDSLKVGRRYLSTDAVAAAVFGGAHLFLLFWAAWLLIYNSNYAAFAFSFCWFPLLMYALLMNSDYKTKNIQPPKQFYMLVSYITVFVLATIVILLRLSS